MFVLADISLRGGGGGDRGAVSAAHCLLGLRQQRVNVPRKRDRVKHNVQWPVCGRGSGASTADSKSEHEQLKQEHRPRLRGRRHALRSAETAHSTAIQQVHGVNK